MYELKAHSHDIDDANQKFFAKSNLNYTGNVEDSGLTPGETNGLLDLDKVEHTTLKEGLGK